MQYLGRTRRAPSQSWLLEVISSLSNGCDLSKSRLPLTDRVLFCVRIADSVSTIGSELSFYWVLFLWCQMCGWGLCVCGEEKEVLKMKLLEEDNAES